MRAQFTFLFVYGCATDRRAQENMQHILGHPTLSFKTALQETFTSKKKHACDPSAFSLYLLFNDIQTRGKSIAWTHQASPGLMPSSPSFLYWSAHYESHSSRRDSVQCLHNCPFIRKHTLRSLTHQQRGIIKFPGNVSASVWYAGTCLKKTAGGGLEDSYNVENICILCSAIGFQHPEYYITAWKVAIAGLTIKDQHGICLNLQREHRKTVSSPSAGKNKPEYMFAHTATWRAR